MIELIAVVAILGIGLLAILSLASYISRLSDVSANRLNAVFLAQWKIENARYTRDTFYANNDANNGGSLKCDGADSFSEHFFGTGANSQSDEKTLNAITYTITSERKNCSGQSINLRVTVLWKYRNRDYTFGPLDFALYDWKGGQGI